MNSYVSKIAAAVTLMLIGFWHLALLETAFQLRQERHAETAEPDGCGKSLIATAHQEYSRARRS